MKGNKLTILNNMKMINNYIFLNFSHYCHEFSSIMCKRNICEDIASFNYIIGRAENYLTDKRDEENFFLMYEWFQKEMSDRDYLFSDFEEFCENEKIDNE